MTGVGETNCQRKKNEKKRERKKERKREREEERNKEKERKREGTTTHIEQAREEESFRKGMRRTSHSLCGTCREKEGKKN